SRSECVRVCSACSRNSSGPCWARCRSMWDGMMVQRGQATRTGPHAGSLWFLIEFSSAFVVYQTSRQNVSQIWPASFTRPKCQAEGSEDPPRRHGDHGEDCFFFSVPSVARWSTPTVLFLLHVHI